MNPRRFNNNVERIKCCCDFLLWGVRFFFSLASRWQIDATGLGFVLMWLMQRGCYFLPVQINDE